MLFEWLASQLMVHLCFGNLIDKASIIVLVAQWERLTSSKYVQNVDRFLFW